jgi:serine/threonine protein kinase
VVTCLNRPSLINTYLCLSPLRSSHRLQKCGRKPRSLFFTFYCYQCFPDNRDVSCSGLYDPLKVDVWSLGATAWELVHGNPPFQDIEDVRVIASHHQLPPVHRPEAFSRSFHDFLNLCSQPVNSRPDPDELLNVRASLPNIS